MRLVLDGGAVTALAGDRVRLLALSLEGGGVPDVPAVVLTESLTGDPRRDVRTNRFLRTCDVTPVDEGLARIAARLCTSTGHAGEISTVDAVVVAHAADRAPSTILTSDPVDLRALAAHAEAPVRVEVA